MALADRIERLLSQPCSRGRYLAFGLGLMFLKFNLDRLLALAFLGHWGWFPWHYLAPSKFAKFEAHRAYRIEGADLWAESGSFLLTLLLTSIPFIAIGLVLTLRRLRAVGWPQPLAGLFFFPFLNGILFALLSIIPDRSDSAKRTGSWGGMPCWSGSMRGPPLSWPESPRLFSVPCPP